MDMFNPEQELFRAIIARAFEDLVARPGQSGAAQADIDAAAAFLTAETGEHARTRVDYCDAAGMCPIKARNAALQLLKAKSPSAQLNRIRTHVFHSD